MSKDLNRLTRDLYNKAFWDEEVSAAYIPSTQEKEIINELLEIFKNQQIQSKDLTENEWNSVFWDDIFARPDIQTNYANEVLKYDEKERSFKYDKEKDHQFRKNIEKMRNSNNKDVTAAEGGFTFFGLFEAEAGGISSSENYKNAKNNENIETKEKDTLSFDDFNKTISKENMNIKWTDTYWIGATDTIKAQTWSWMDNSSLAFNNWVKGQPQNTFESNCGAGLMQGGKWISDNCNKQKPFICEFKDATDAPTKLNSPVCPVSWTFYNTTGFCYKVMDNATWKGAETRCKAENAHLASVHSIEESLILADLAYYPGVHGCTWPTHAWIGLFTEDRNVHWNWTDKTPYNYAKWMPGHPNPPEINQNCGYIYLAPCTTTKTGDFDNAPCERVLPKFICKKQP
uniref:C-type lectin domain-containing protein n=1 Tax=Panagrolaimus davidi TaxID=227884 RepID=A0A914QP75_9BILA